MEGTSSQIHVLSSRAGDLIEGKNGRKKNKTGGVADADGWSSCGLLAEEIWKYRVSWRRVSEAWGRWLNFHELIACATM
jgi:hypothetical protein